MVPSEIMIILTKGVLVLTEVSRARLARRCGRVQTHNPIESSEPNNASQITLRCDSL